MTTRQKETADIPDKRDRWIPWMFVLFFVVVGSVDAVMVTLALRTNTGVVTDKAYEKGLAYNETLAAAAAQDKLGWRDETVFDGRHLSFSLRDGAGAPLRGAEVRARLTRPVSAGHDFEVVLAEAGDSYGAPVSFPLVGEWQARIFVKWQDKHYQSSRILMIR